jgi:serine/threonine protein kinase
MTAWSSALGTLADWKVNGRLEALDWAGRKALCRELCDGLHVLHARASVVHRDLKPENVLFKSESGRDGPCRRGLRCHSSSPRFHSYKEYPERMATRVRSDSAAPA